MGSKSRSSSSQTNNSTSNTAVTNNSVSAGGDANNVTARNFFGDYNVSDQGAIDAAFRFAGDNNQSLMQTLNDAQGANVALARDLTDSAFEFAGGAFQENLALTGQVFDTVEDQISFQSNFNQGILDFTANQLDNNAIAQQGALEYSAYQTDSALTFAGEAANAALLRVDDALAATSVSQTESREDRKALLATLAVAGGIAVVLVFATRGR